MAIAIGRRGASRFAAVCALLFALGGMDAANRGHAETAGAATEMETLLQPGALEEKVLGAADSPVTIVEYASMTCGHCARFHTETLPKLKTRYIDTGKVRYVMRSLPTDPRAEAGLLLAYCAGDKYFAMSDLLYKQQENWARVPDARSALLKIARMAGFSQESFEACLTDRQLLDDVRLMRDRGLEQLGITAAPTFFINGVKHTGAMSIDEMSAIIDGMH
ncbi:DsbA family protein [Nitratireductor soli]|uniref:DsbA family protein n=1 Tax=Nitratireductor soli TaxID=1670619 RepID=UPI00065E5B56|nr:DsbA family protein [Nitratireductor soli]